MRLSPPRLASVVDTASRLLEVSLDYASSRRHHRLRLCRYIKPLPYFYKADILSLFFFFKLRICGVRLKSENEATCG